MQSLPQFKAGDPLSAGKLQTLSDTLGTLLNSRIANGSIGCYGIASADLQPEGFWARVLGNNGQIPPAHTWVQVTELDAADYIQKRDGVFGSADSLPLYEINGKTLEENAVVFVWRGVGDYYLTNCCGESTGWVKITSTTQTTLQLVRLLPDCRIDRGDTVLTCATGNFTAADVGREVVSENLPAGATIQSIIFGSDGITGISCVLDQPAEGNTDNFEAILLTDSISVYPAVQTFFGDSDGKWHDAQNPSWFQPANSSDSPILGRIYQCRQIGQDQNGTPLWCSEFSSSDEAWVQVAATSPGKVYLGGRLIEDGVLNGTTTLTSNTANFTAADVGFWIAGPGIPDNTVISSVQSVTSCTLSNAASTSNTNVAVVVAYTGLIQAYQAQIATPNGTNGPVLAWNLGDTVWFVGVNNEIPVSGTRYQARYLSKATDGTKIYGSVFDPNTWIRISSNVAQKLTVQSGQVAVSPRVFSASIGFNGSGQAAWYFATNDVAPTSYGPRLCRQVGTDKNGVPVYTSGEDFGVVILQCSSSTPVSFQAGELTLYYYPKTPIPDNGYLTYNLYPLGSSSSPSAYFVDFNGEIPNTVEFYPCRQIGWTNTNLPIYAGFNTGDASPQNYRGLIRNDNQYIGALKYFDAIGVGFDPTKPPLVPDPNNPPLPGDSPIGNLPAITGRTAGLGVAGSTITGGFVSSPLLYASDPNAATDNVTALGSVFLCPNDAAALSNNQIVCYNNVLNSQGMGATQNKGLAGLMTVVAPPGDFAPDQGYNLLTCGYPTASLATSPSIGIYIGCGDSILFGPHQPDVYVAGTQAVTGTDAAGTMFLSGWAIVVGGGGGSGDGSGSGGGGSNPPSFNSFNFGSDW